MIRVIFFILTFGFIIQCTGTTLYLKKAVVKTEQCPDDNQPGEENSKEEFKKDKDQISINLINELSSGKVVYCIPDHHQQFYPTGFFSKPYLPPR